MVIVVTLLLAALTWLFVEKPFRNKNRVSRKSIVVTSIVTGVCISIVGLVVYINSGFVNRWPEMNTKIAAAGRGLNAVYNERPFQYKSVPFKDPEKSNILILGSSYARDFINAALENSYFSASEISYSDNVPICINGENAVDPGLRKLISETDYLIFGSPTISFDCWKHDF